MVADSIAACELELRCQDAFFPPLPVVPNVSRWSVTRSILFSCSQVLEQERSKSIVGVSRGNAAHVATTWRHRQVPMQGITSCVTAHRPRVFLNMQDDADDFLRLCVRHFGIQRTSFDGTAATMGNKVSKGKKARRMRHVSPRFGTR